MCISTIGRCLLTSLLNVIPENEREKREPGCHAAGGAIRIRQCVRRDRDRARFSRACNYYLYLGESGASLLKPIKKGGGRGESRGGGKGLV